MLSSGCRVDLVGYSSMICVAAKLRDLAKAEFWVSALYRKGFTPNVIVWNTLLHACARAGNATKAAAWMTAMQRAGAKPSAVSYNCLIEAGVSAGDKAAAEFWLQRMLEAGFEPDRITISILSRKFGSKEGKGSRSDTTPPKWALIVLIMTHLRLGKIASTQRWLEAARKAGCSLPRALRAELSAEPGDSGMAKAGRLQNPSSVATPGPLRVNSATSGEEPVFLCETREPSSLSDESSEPCASYGISSVEARFSSDWGLGAGRSHEEMECALRELAAQPAAGLQAVEVLSLWRCSPCRWHLGCGACAA